jgi:hypothetical protein
VDLIGHSAGAQLVGLMPNHGAIRRVLMVAASSGYVWGLRFPYSIAAYGYLRFYLPATARLLGYSPGRAIGMGEDLPAGVARQWSRWCLGPGYVENEFGRGISHHYYHAVCERRFDCNASQRRRSAAVVPPRTQAESVLGSESPWSAEPGARRFFSIQPIRRVAPGARLAARREEPLMCLGVVLATGEPSGLRRAKNWRTSRQ